MSNNQLTIGALAKACGVNVESIRYYHRIGQSEGIAGAAAPGETANRSAARATCVSALLNRFVTE